MVLIFQDSGSCLRRYEVYDVAVDKFAGIPGDRQHGYAQSHQRSFDHGGAAPVQGSFKKRGRKPLPADLPRVDVVHDLPEEEKHCDCGAPLSCIGQDVSEKLDYVPAKIRVIRHIRYKYACKSCEGVESEDPTVKIAPPPVQLIPKSIATEGLIAHLIVSKFADGLPLYRQQKIAGWALNCHVPLWPTG